MPEAYEFIFMDSEEEIPKIKEMLRGVERAKGSVFSFDKEKGKIIFLVSIPTEVHKRFYLESKKAGYKIKHLGFIL
ncbi:MAG: hypothetical protein QXT38_04520 [Candidatus Aenigmatarchaeota archaeon]